VNTIQKIQRKNQLIGVVDTLAAAAAVHDTLAAVHSDRGVVDIFIVEIKFFVTVNFDRNVFETRFYALNPTPARLPDVAQ